MWLAFCSRRWRLPTRQGRPDRWDRVGVGRGRTRVRRSRNGRGIRRQRLMGRRRVKRRRLLRLASSRLRVRSGHGIGLPPRAFPRPPTTTFRLRLPSPLFVLANELRLRWRRPFRRCRRSRAGSCCPGWRAGSRVVRTPQEVRRGGRYWSCLGGRGPGGRGWVPVRCGASSSVMARLSIPMAGF